MSKIIKAMTNQPWKPGESQLNAFEAVDIPKDSTVVFQTRPLLGQSGLSEQANECVKTADLIILKMLEIW